MPHLFAGGNVREYGCPHAAVAHRHIFEGRVPRSQGTDPGLWQLQVRKMKGKYRKEKKWKKRKWENDKPSPSVNKCYFLVSFGQYLVDIKRVRKIQFFFLYENHAKGKLFGSKRNSKREEKKRRLIKRTLWCLLRPASQQFEKPNGIFDRPTGNFN